MNLIDLYTLINYANQLENYIELRLVEGIDKFLQDKLIKEVESVRKRIDQLTKENDKYYYEKRVTVESKINIEKKSKKIA